MQVVEREMVSSYPAKKRAEGKAVSLPRKYSEYVVFVDTLRQTGLLSYLSTLVLARRAGAYELSDLVLFFISYFSASQKGTSIADFAESSAEYGYELAGVGERVRWLKQPSTSRALQAVSEAHGYMITQKLLEVTARVAIQSKLCSGLGYRDGNGVPCRVLHWDTSVETIRKRALPHGDKLPHGIRLSDELARPGYAGRKRGEGVYARSIVSDATSGVWLHMDMCSGSGSVESQTTKAADACQRFLKEQGEDYAQSVIVCDGVSGGLPQTRAIISKGMHILTRNIEYSRLQTKAAVKLMEKSHWLPVEDSRSGPRREAIDLGIRSVFGHKLRVIVSRFPSKKKQRGAGHTIGQWHYELFISSLPKEGWAANDLVTLYYGRTAIENRFAAEDREFDLARTFSFSRPGQAFACGIAMALWNHRIATGLASVSERVPKRPERLRSKVPRENQTGTTEGTREPTQVVVASIEKDKLFSSQEEPNESEKSAGQDEGDEPAPARFDADLAAFQKTKQWCSRQIGWEIDEESQKLKCPKDKLLSRTICQRRGKLTARFRAQLNACAGCALRGQCMPSSSSLNSPKELNFSLKLPDPVGQEDPQEPHEFLFETLTEQPEVPKFLPDAPLLLPAVLRKRAVTLFSSCHAAVFAPFVNFNLNEELSDHIARNLEERQRRRQTIEDRVASNARPLNKNVNVSLRCSPEHALTLARLKLAFQSG